MRQEPGDEPVKVVDKKNLRFGQHEPTAFDKMQMDKAQKLRKKKIEEEPELDKVILDELAEIAQEIETKMNKDQKPGGAYGN